MRRTVELIFLLLVACSSTPLTEDQIYDRDDAKQQRLEEFDRFSDKCRAAKGVVVITRRSLHICRRGRCPPERQDSYNCVNDVM